MVKRDSGLHSKAFTMSMCFMLKVVSKNNFCVLGPKLNGLISVHLFCTGKPVMRQGKLNVMVIVPREFKD